MICSSTSFATFFTVRLEIARGFQANDNYYSTHWEFFPPALADGFLLVFEWQQVSSSLQDSSQYSDRSQQCCSLDGLGSFSDFQLFSSL